MKRIFFAIGWLIMSGLHAQEETPAYLYKVIPLRNWQASQSGNAIRLSAEDDRFIHLSREEQLSRILNKYWNNAPQVVVMKLDVAKLPGNLVLETNPGGENKYYHLYEGFIPFAAVVESKIEYRKPYQTSQVSVVQIGDPVLREVARPLSKEEILSPEIQDLIEEMKQAMRNAPGVGLAAPQIGRSIQLAVLEDMEHGFLTPEQLKAREREKFPLMVIINPKIHLEETEQAAFFEGCLSIPGVLGIVPRARRVRVECLNEKGEAVVIHASGWKARILQHEIDHLHGVLCIDKMRKETMTTEANYIQHWKGTQPGL
jgi:peptide deformylase